MRFLIDLFDSYSFFTIPTFFILVPLSYFLTFFPVLYDFFHFIPHIFSLDLHKCEYQLYLFVQFQLFSSFYHFDFLVLHFLFLEFQFISPYLLL